MSPGSIFGVRDSFSRILNWSDAEKVLGVPVSCWEEQCNVYKIEKYGKKNFV